MEQENNRKLGVHEMGRLSPNAFKQVHKHPMVVVLDNIRSMHNVGAAFRTADAFKATALCLCGITARPPHREINKTALGATETVDWTYQESIATALKKLKAEGYVIVLVEQTAQSVPLQNYPFQADARYAFVLGNEVAGVSEEALPLADACLEIPQFGTKHSLNVSVATGIVLWDFLSRTHL